MNNTRFSSTEQAVNYILSTLGISNPTIKRTENGKPYLINDELSFSVSHTSTYTFIALSNENIGIDAENLKRNVHYNAILKKFSCLERKSIQTNEDFLSFWTVKESVIKWLGGTIAHDLKQIFYENGQVFYKNTPLSVIITQIIVDGHILSVCSQQNHEFIITYLE